jgi:hypothetical protein
VMANQTLALSLVLQWPRSFLVRLALAEDLMYENQQRVATATRAFFLEQRCARIYLLDSSPSSPLQPKHIRSTCPLASKCLPWCRTPLALTCASTVAGADSSPRTEVPSSREHSHVRSYFGENAGGAIMLNAGNAL